jgi:predicted nuclease of predicted toxin-antitoxin system
VKLLLDENLSPHQSVVLRGLDYDAVRVVEIGLAGAPDERIREYAITEDRVLMTLDADFANLLRFPPAGTPGVIRLKVHPPTEAAIRDQIQRALTLLTDRNLRGCLAVYHAGMVRIRS